MNIHRYEMDDGGGPFCKLDGTVRNNTKIKFNDNYCDGCSSLKELYEYFSNKKEYIKNCKIKKYIIPDDESIIRKKCISFPKKYVLLKLKNNYE